MHSDTWYFRKAETLQCNARAIVCLTNARRRTALPQVFRRGLRFNPCVPLGDEGTLAVGRWGHEALVLQDCTTRMESFETGCDTGNTHGAAPFLKMVGRGSITSEGLIAGLPVQE